MSEEIRISVALVTRNRPDSLRRCLTSLRAQEAQPFEIVISDDSDDPAATSAMAKEFGGRHVHGPRRGLYANRNAAALACAGTHIRTMDDDHTFPQDHFERCLASVQSDPLAMWTTGETGFVDGEFFATVECASELQRSGVGGPVHDRNKNWAIADGSTIYPAEIFARGLRMVEEFRYGLSYLEFGIYLHALGWVSRCVPGAVVDHHGDRATIERGTNREFQASCIFAAICFNRFFRPNLASLGRSVAGHLAGNPALITHLPALSRLAKQRWRNIPKGAR